MNETLLKQAERSGLYHLPSSRFPALRLAAEKCSLRLVSLEPASSMDKTALLKGIGETLHFPEWYGANLDALHDCLTDLDLLPEKGLVLLLPGLDTLRKAAPDDFAGIIEVLQSAAEAYRETSTPCWVITDCRARGIHSLPVG